MTDGTLEPQIRDLERLVSMADPTTQSNLRKDVEALIEALDSEQRQPPEFLHRLRRLLAVDPEEEFFDNLPV